MTSQIFLFIGSSSVITKELAQKYATQGHIIILAGRDTQSMNRLGTVLKSLGAQSTYALELDTQQFTSHDVFAQSVQEICKNYQYPKLNIIALSAIMPSQDAINQFPEKGVACIQTGFTGLVSVLHQFINFFELHQQGSVTIFGSVAGDRGRLNNYVYGATKAGLACYASGLRNHLGRHNVHVMLVKPGFMNTPMIEGMKLPPLPIAEPKDVADIVAKSLDKKRNTIYVPGFWRLIMGIIQNIPECIFKKMSF